MNYVQDKNDIILYEEHFNLTHTFECGQCFRWNSADEKGYLGIAMGKLLKVSRVRDGAFRFYDITLKDFEDIWLDYFDLNTDYGKIKQSLSGDSVLKEAIQSGYGIRLLNQDVFETVMSFIISANNNIPRIKLIIERLCQSFGKKLSGNFYTFPSPEAMKGVNVSDLACLKAGFRDKYLVDAVEKITSGEVCLKNIKSLSFEDAKKELLKIKGIGEKVANCILLFSLNKRSAFPVDVWVKRVVGHYYGDSVSHDSDFDKFAKERFGDLSGYAQQYLFYHARELNLK